MVSIEDNVVLTVLPNADEVRRVVFDMEPSSSPGLEDFRAVMYFFETLHIPFGLNSSFVMLISKKPGANRVEDFRPIVIGGIAAKILTPFQFGFIPGKLIHTCIALASDAINILDNPTRIGNMALKIDMHKAFDTVSWSFLISMLEKLGFSTLFCVKHGNLLSSLLFCIAEEALGRWIDWEVLSGHITQISRALRHCSTHDEWGLGIRSLRIANDPFIWIQTIIFGVAQSLVSSLPKSLMISYDSLTPGLTGLLGVGAILYPTVAPLSFRERSGDNFPLWIGFATLATRFQFGKQLSYLWRVAFITTLWMIWRARNKFIFEDIHPTIHECLTFILASIRETDLLALGHMDGSVRELVILGRLRLSGRPPPLKIIIVIRWKPPQAGWYKLMGVSAGVNVQMRCVSWVVSARRGQLSSGISRVGYQLIALATAVEAIS
ncbi:hypothetical protein ACS0TY_013791 [Phlomoides rotata]